MAGFSGNKMLLQLPATHDATTYVTVAALRNTSWNINKTSIDATTKDGNGWSEFVEGGGLKTVNFTADGVWTSNTVGLVDGPDADTTANDRMGHGTLQSAAFTSANHYNARIIMGDGGDASSLTGRFHVDSLTRTGELNGLDTFSVTMTSSGTVTWAAT